MLSDQKEDDLPQKQCVCNGPLFLPAAALQDVPHYHSRVNAIQQHMDLFLIKPVSEMAGIPPKRMYA